MTPVTRRLIFLSLLAFTWTVARPGAQEAFSHDAWERVLARHVTPEGLVDYRALQQDRGDLDRYVAAVQRTSPDNAPEMFPTDAHRLAYWINAYNALIVARVVDRYPIASIRDLGSLFSSVFKKEQIVGGKPLSYDAIEHTIVRPRFREPRIHFVLNCASKSCAPLGRHALTAANLEGTLQEAAVAFLNNPRNVGFRPDTGTVELSRYFDWFADDFKRGTGRGAGTPVLEFIRPFLTPERQQILAGRRTWRVGFIDYDWSLNDAGPAR